MIKLLTLFISFFEIGAFTFGGGYAMISLIMDKVVSNGWLTEAEILNMIAVSESTPGPIAVNMATFVGASQAGILGSVFSTLGVVLPSFIIILFISAVLHNFLKYNGVRAFLSGVRPCVVALILGTGITLCLSTLFNFKSFGESSFSPDIKGIAIFAVVLLASLIYKKLKKKKLSPIFVIIISAVLGMLLYSV